MRVSSLQMFQQGISSILAQQAKLSNTENQLATGKRLLTPADDPVAAAQVLDISEDLELLDQYQRNANLAQGQLALEESVLTEAETTLQRVRELVVQANNATQSPDTRRSIAAEISARLDELESIANTRDASGEYIFGGYQAQNQPFTRSGADVLYQGDDGQRFMQIGNSARVAVRDSGYDVFVAVPTGNGRFGVEAGAGNTGNAVAGSTTAGPGFVAGSYSISFASPPGGPTTYEVRDASAALVSSGNYEDGDTLTFAGASIDFSGVPGDGDTFTVASSVRRDMFGTLQDIVSVLENSGTQPNEVAAVNNAMARGLDNIDQALGNVSRVRTDVGVRLNYVDTQVQLNDNFNLSLQETLSGIEDLDYAEAISRFNLELTALQAAQQAYVKMQGLSLFNYL
ncbi:flagellar hook-associated protein FlgL [Pseudohalioglobus lutimaris]|uniref:Flagellar hook-associated protein 3 n=1 Tax=Pseudohalioglobus lutimaris TaxID=1737061 RepID=A0A2N5X1B7_9GAMM|nr:flagellar hook-associated protein FlgL [Pseudohalioglobus lutimaris]PLW68284.1 flagellar hook-associated protein 3 [Pseudohalioglobus lutimaris]